MAIKVSIYEDNNTLRESLTYLIRGAAGLEFCSASPSAVEILEQCEEHQPDIILMDIDMPGITGIEATRLVKNKFPDINVMILTVFEDKEKIFEALCAGATGYLLKKTPSSQIIESIEELYRAVRLSAAASHAKCSNILPRPMGAPGRIPINSPHVKSISSNAL